LHSLNRIHTAANQLLGIINNVLDLSKIEAGKVELYPESFDIATLINEVVMTVQPLVEKNSNKLKIQYGDNVGIMYADMVRTRQVLINILNNAAKFTKHGQVTLRVNSTQINAVEWIVFQVIDTGIGMTSEQINRLFNDFQQAESSTTRKFGGTGLGLAISRRFCELMGGEIRLESQPNQGSVFTITLPAYAQPVTAKTAS
jgi:signal transduction histidine kinase